MTRQQAEEQARYAATRYNRTFHIGQRGDSSWTYSTEASGLVVAGIAQPGTEVTFQPDPVQVAKYEAYWGHRAAPKDLGAQRERLARTSPANSVL